MWKCCLGRRPRVGGGWTGPSCLWSPGARGLVHLDVWETRLDAAWRLVLALLPTCCCPRPRHSGSLWPVS